MIKLFAKLILGTLILIISACQTQKPVLSVRPAEWASKVDVQVLYNFYKVDKNLYRSEQTGKKVMKQLDSMGFKTIVNLRQIHNDYNEAKNTRLVLNHIPINTRLINYADVLSAMKIIMKSEKPVLIHCKHGSDRTGCIVAVYRMVVCNWTKQDAVREFREGGFGYHEKWYPNILRLLNSINIDQLKKDINN
jgi:tyrosine-protein phosphatase SIW14